MEYVLVVIGTALTMVIGTYLLWEILGRSRFEDWHPKKVLVVTTAFGIIAMFVLGLYTLDPWVTLAILVGLVIGDFFACLVFDFVRHEQGRVSRELKRSLVTKAPMSSDEKSFVAIVFLICAVAGMLLTDSILGTLICGIMGSLIVRNLIDRYECAVHSGGCDHLERRKQVL